MTVQVTVFFSDSISDPGVCVADYKTKLYLDAVLRHWQSVALSEGLCAFWRWSQCQTAVNWFVENQLVFPCVFPVFFHGEDWLYWSLQKLSLSRSWGCWFVGFFCLFVKLSKLFNHSDCRLILKLNLMLVLYGLFVAARTKIISSPVSFDMKTMMIVQ